MPTPCTSPRVPPPRVPRVCEGSKALALAAYALSPVDLIPDFIPILGYLDDLIIVPLGIALAVRLVPADVTEDNRALAGWEGNLNGRPKWWGKLVALDPDVAEYLKNNKPPPGVRWHRQLTENISIRGLVSRCYEVIGMAKECRDMRELRDKVARHYGRQVVQFNLSLPMPPEAT